MTGSMLFPGPDRSDDAARSAAGTSRSSAKFLSASTSPPRVEISLASRAQEPPKRSLEAPHPQHPVDGSVPAELPFDRGVPAALRRRTWTRCWLATLLDAGTRFSAEHPLLRRAGPRCRSLSDSRWINPRGIDPPDACAGAIENPADYSGKRAKSPNPGVAQSLRAHPGDCAERRWRFRKRAH